MCWCVCECERFRAIPGVLSTTAYRDNTKTTRTGGLPPPELQKFPAEEDRATYTSATQTLHDSCKFRFEIGQNTRNSVVFVENVSKRGCTILRHTIRHIYLRRTGFLSNPDFRHFNPAGEIQGEIRFWLGEVRGVAYFGEFLLDFAHFARK